MFREISAAVDVGWTSLEVEMEILLITQEYPRFFYFFLLSPFLGASPTTSASILVEFGGDDWAAGCVVAHVISHTYISPAVRHTPHTRIHCAAMLACEAPDPLARNTGVRSQVDQRALGAYQPQSFSQSSP